MLPSQLYENITMWSCFINGEPGVAIVALDEVGENKIAVMPLFVSITPNMELVFPGERDSAGAGGGPKNPREVVKLNKGLTTHCPRPAPS
jgi:hypothetical protein